MKRFTDLTHMSNEQLMRRLIEVKASLMRVKGEDSVGKPHRGGNNSMLSRKLKKEKARILTLLSERLYGYTTKPSSIPTIRLPS
jgi:ribosomal protein L29